MDTHCHARTRRNTLRSGSSWRFTASRVGACPRGFRAVSTLFGLRGRSVWSSSCCFSARR